ncbi:MAG: hypothetical protein QF793_03615, partial [Candidatus Peribacteraceae bacterium]|nr:hypothetical protein [Candidatus Peribacteraceae bacterium]
MNTPLSIANCINLSPKDQRIVDTAQPESVDGEDPRMAILAEGAIKAASVVNFNQKGMLIINDGDEVNTDVWRRLTLVGKKPIEVLPQNMLIEMIASNFAVRKCLQEATTIVAPRSAGPRVLAALSACDASLTDSKKIIEPFPDRVLNPDRSIKEITLQDSDTALFAEQITQDDRVVILDDVASSYRTASRIAENVRQASCVDVITLLAAVPRQQDVAFMRASGINSVLSAGVTQYKKLPNNRPAITTTAGIFDQSERSIRSFENLCRYLRDDGAALRLLLERLRSSMSVLLMDLDGTSLVDGAIPDSLCTVLQKARSQLFSVVTTARSQNSFDSLSDETRSVFRAGVFDDGLSVRINGTTIPAVDRKLNVSELTKLIERAARKADALVCVTQKATSNRLPWKVRIRQKNGDIESSDYSDADTQAALQMAGVF